MGGRSQIAHRIRRIQRLAAMLCLLAGSVTSQQTVREAEEYEVKAAFLLNFVKFVEWSEAQLRNLETFPICILGADPFGQALDQIVTGETIAGRPVVVRRIRRWESTCRVLFTASAGPEVAVILAGVGQGVLTVGEGEGFLRRNGMIAFVLESRRVRFDINQQALKNGSIQISSRMLTVARRVEP